MTGEASTNYEASQRGARVGLLAYIILAVAKLTVGWWAGSRALVADGINNVTDIIGTATALLGLRIAGRPADEEHPYGHQRAETIATLVVGTIMAMVGLDVAVSAGAALFRPDLEVPEPLAMWVGAASALVMLAVYTYNLRLSRRTGSKVLEAAAYDHLSDAITAAGTVVGVLGARMGLPWLDPLAGLVVAGVIIRTAYHIGIDSARSLMDGFDVASQKELRRRAAGVAGVVRVHSLRARSVGNLVYVDVTIGVKPNLTIVEAHAVSDGVEAALQGQLGVECVHVHVEPLART